MHDSVDHAELSHDQQITQRAIAAHGGRQASLARAMGLPGGRALVSLLASGERCLTTRVGMALSVATQDTDDPIPPADVFPRLFAPLPSAEEWKIIVVEEEKDRKRFREIANNAKMERMENKENNFKYN